MLGFGAGDVISRWETGDRSPDAHSLTAYAHALSATLLVDPPLPDVDLEDEIAVYRACRGSLRWAHLTQAQRLQVYTLLRARRWSKQRIAAHLHISGSTLVSLEASRAPRQNGGAA